MNIHYVGYGLAIALALLVAFKWHQSEIANARAEEQSKAKDSVIKQNQDGITAANKALQQANAALDNARSKPATVQTVEKYLPTPLPQGSTLQLLPGTAFPGDNGAIITQHPILELQGDPQKNLNWIQSMELDHQMCDNSLKTCQGNLVRLQAIADANKDKADAWQKAADKHTGFWNRTKLALNCLWKPAVGAGIGYGIGSLSGRNNGSLAGATAGAAAGGVACTF